MPTTTTTTTTKLLLRAAAAAAAGRRRSICCQRFCTASTAASASAPPTSCTTAETRQVSDQSSSCSRSLGSVPGSVDLPLDDECESRDLSPLKLLRAYPRTHRSRSRPSALSQVRDEGRIPAVLVNDDHRRSSPRSRQKKKDGGSGDVFLSLDAKPIAAILKLIGKRDFVSRVFDMNIYRDPHSNAIQESLQVLPRNLNYGPGKTNILNIQFIRVNPDQTLKLGVPLEYLGIENCPGLIKGGTLIKLEKYILYNCKATEVPAKIVVDMTVLEVGDRVLVQDLEVDFDLLHSDRTMPVCEIVKDAETLKAKAKKLKREIFHKRKALKEENATPRKTSVRVQSLEEENGINVTGTNVSNDQVEEGTQSGIKKPKPTFRMRKKTLYARSSCRIPNKAIRPKQGKLLKEDSSSVSNNLGERTLKHA